MHPRRPIRPLLLLTLALPATGHARELTLEKKPFDVPASFTATVVPEHPDHLLLDAHSASEFKILSILPHGSRVKKGDVLVTFDPEEIDRQIEESRRTRETNAQSLAELETDLAILRKSTALQLEDARRARRIAAEDLAHFETTGKKASEERNAEALKHAKEQLESAKEELSQLEKMYKADDITDETEEFILKRQRSTVASAELALKHQQQESERFTKTELPRKEETLRHADQQSTLNLRDAEENLPRHLKTKEIEFTAAQSRATRFLKKLADLEADRALFTLKAPADGWFYHGSMENGRWSTGDATKSLVRDGHVAPHRPFATFIPLNTPQILSAFVDETTARALRSHNGLHLSPAGREDLSTEAELLRTADVPGTDGTWRIDLQARPLKGWTTSVGSSWNVRTVIHHQDAAISVPQAALHHEGESWTVQLKLADGNAQTHTVTRGRANHDAVEILSGLEAGQVLIIPDKSAP